MNECREPLELLQGREGLTALPLGVLRKASAERRDIDALAFARPPQEFWFDVNPHSFAPASSMGIRPIRNRASWSQFALQDSRMTNLILAQFVEVSKPSRSPRQVSSWLSLTREPWNATSKPLAVSAASTQPQSDFASNGNPTAGRAI